MGIRKRTHISFALLYLFLNNFSYLIFNPHVSTYSNVGQILMLEGYVPAKLCATWILPMTVCYISNLRNDYRRNYDFISNILSQTLTNLFLYYMQDHANVMFSVEI